MEANHAAQVAMQKTDVATARCATGTVLCPIHTADADATKLFCCVGVGGVNTNSQLVGDSFVVSSVRTHPSAVVTQFTISCADK